MWELDYEENWAPTNDALEVWCWRRLLRVPWTARRSNQSILKEISPEYSLEVLMLKLKLQYLATWCEELTPLKRPWCWERLKVGGEGDDRGGEGDDRGWDGWMASPIPWTWVWVKSGSWWWTRRPGMLQSMWSQRVGHDWVNELNWTQCCFYTSCSWNYLLTHFTIIYHCVSCLNWFPNKDVNTFYCKSFNDLTVCLCSTHFPLDKLFNISQLKFSQKAHLIGLFWKLNQTVCITFSLVPCLV